MKNNTKLIMETWRRYLTENIDEDPRTYDPEEGRPLGRPVTDPHLSGDLSDSGFDRETQGPDDYVPDEMIIDEILAHLRMSPSASDEDLKQMFGAFDEDIEAARSRFDMESQQDEMEMPLSDSDYDF